MWRPATEDDVIASMSVAEIEGYKNSANWDQDPIQILLRRTIAFVRDQIRTNGNIALSPNELEIPEGAISPAMDMLVFDIVKRLGGTTTTERRNARQSAFDYFKEVAEGKRILESWGAAGTAATGGPAIEIVKSAQPRLTPEKLKGL